MEFVDEGRTIVPKLKIVSWIAALFFLFLFMFAPKADAASWVNTGAPNGMAIQSLTTGTDGKIWAGTGNGNIYYWSSSSWVNTGQPNGYSVSSLTTGTDGKIWAGTGSGYIYHENDALINNS